MNQDELKLEFVKTRLIDEHSKRKGMTSSQSHQSNEAGAMNATGHRKLKCFGCGKIGHIKSKCRALKNSNNENKNSNESGNKSGNDKAAKKTANKAATMMCAVVNEHEKSCNTKQTVEAHTVQRDDDTSKIKFLMDSGATQHMVNDERYFDHVKNVDDIEIRIAKKNQCILAKQEVILL